MLETINWGSKTKNPDLCPKLYRLDRQAYWKGMILNLMIFGVGLLNMYKGYLLWMNSLVRILIKKLINVFWKVLNLWILSTNRPKTLNRVGNAIK